MTDAPGDSRKERKSKTYARLASVEGDEQLALIVKTADRLANVRACVKDGNQRLLAIYQEEHAVFTTSVHRVNLCDALWIELDKIIAQCNSISSHF